MPVNHPGRHWARALAALLPLVGAGMVVAPTVARGADDLRKADATTQALLRRADFEQLQLSPDGTMIAVVRRRDQESVVTIVSTSDFKTIRNIVLGKDGEVDTLLWLGNTRLIVGANKTVARFGMPLVPPRLFVVPGSTGSEVTELPANFLAVIDDDPEELLVTRCRWTSAGECRQVVYRTHIGRAWTGGEPLVTAPEVDAQLLADRKGRVRFAVGYDDLGDSHTWVLADDGKTWSLINDASKSGLAVSPAGMDSDGRRGILFSERAHGTDVVERYDFASGRREVLLQDPASDPLVPVRDMHTGAVIGAEFGATRPRLKFWASTHAQARLQAQLDELFPDRMARLTSMSDDDRLAIVLTESDRDPGTFHLVDTNAGTVRTLAQAYPWLDGSALASIREVSIAARDGVALKGLLTVPAGREAVKLPLVVIPHGGPFWVHDDWGYDAEQQILASRGYAVLRVNFRGSGGYGREFLVRGQRQWGKAMQDDVTDATRWAIAQGIADPARVCIYGASYGAYAAMMGAIREPALYRCAAGYAGVYDLNKLYRWDSLRKSDLGREFLHRAVGTDQADLAANSPAQQAGRIRANVFLAHGRLDGIADLRFARQLEKAINRTRDQRVELIEYPNQGHGLRVPAQREDFYARLLAFLHDNLDGPATAGAPVEAAGAAP
jgi:dipeptidyl aminopeptidase/acylaminoacyl peptidase